MVAETKIADGRPVSLTDQLQALPAAIARAIRSLDKHPQILEIDIGEREKDTDPVVVTLQIKTELPTRWKGLSPHGVKRVEPVVLTFPISYPVFAPRPTLRMDFPRWHPHLQPGSESEPPEPCLVFGSPRELIQTSGGILALLQQLLDWLDRAAMLKLNDPKHGWEYVRRDHLDDIVVSDSSKIRKLVGRKHGGSWHRTFVLAETNDDTVTYRVSLQADKKATIDDPTIESLRHFKKEKNEWTGLSLGLIAWPGRLPNGQPFVCDTYKPETVSNVKELFDRAELYGCRNALDTKLKWLRQKLASFEIKLTLPISIVLIARRPFNLIGQASALEVCPYLIECQSAEDLKPTSTSRVRLAGHRETISVDVLRRTSGSDAKTEWLPWTLLGSGSLGSKVAMHLGRAGHGPDVVIDNDRLEPHNFARHTSIPVSAELDSMFYSSKAHDLALDLKKLSQNPLSYNLDANVVLRSKAVRDKFKLSKTKAIINTTASAVLRETISAVKWPNGKCPRLIDASFMGDADVGYCAIAGADANPNCGDLATEFYHGLRSDSELRGKVMGHSQSEIAIGQGCSSISMVASDVRLSMLAAPIAAHAQDVLSQKSASDSGQLRIGRISEDGVSQAWTTTDVAPYTIVSRAHDEAVESRLAQRVTTEIDAEIARKPGSETGGVLIGRFSAISNAFHVVDTLPAPPDSKFSAEEFVLGTEGLKDALKEIAEESGNTLYALGTWHNHLQPSGPSNTDIHTAVKLAIGQLFPVLMIIRTPKGFHQLTAEAIGISSHLPQNSKSI